jgi:hypothetical protein
VKTNKNMRMDFARHIYTNLLQIRVVTSTAIQISTGAKAFLELNSAAIHFVSSYWIQTKCRANESCKKSF